MVRLFRYAHLGHNEEALRFFVEMKRTGEKANRSIFLCILSTCSEITALELGFQLHAQLVKVGLRSGWYVGNALLSMYCKCGNIDEANAIFEEISDKDIVSWNTIIAGYARHGFGQEALRVFESMKTSGVKPDQVTMVGVLSACSHSGLVDRGTHYFYTMNHAATWGALLGANRIHGNTELGEKAAEMVFLIMPEWTTGVKRKSQGYISSPKLLVLHDVEEEEKELMLRYHSEKLAVAFGILNIQAGRPIRVFKNLRHSISLTYEFFLLEVLGAAHCPYNHQCVSVQITAKSLCSVP
ncbi:pentatricopeptide repeat-containing protein [Tanacetum coccineum]